MLNTRSYTLHGVKALSPSSSCDEVAKYKSYIVLIWFGFLAFVTILFSRVWL